MSDHKHEYVLIGGDTVAAMCPQCKENRNLPRLPASPLTWNRSGIAHLTHEEVERRINQEDGVKTLVEAVEEMANWFGNVREYQHFGVLIDMNEPSHKSLLARVRNALKPFKFTIEPYWKKRGCWEQGVGVAGGTLPVPEFKAFTWTCHICKEERSDLKISVLSKPIPNIPENIASQNIRYCNDNPECIEGAKDFTHISKTIPWDDHGNDGGPAMGLFSSTYERD